MDIFNINLLGIVILSIILVILLFCVYKICLLIANEKRIASFAIDKKIKENSITDDILNILWHFIKIISKIVSKNKYLSNYSKKLDKYLIYSKNENITTDNYISLKFIIMLIIQLLYFTSISIKYLKFNILIFIIISLLGFYSVDLIIIINYNNKKKLIEEQLLQAIVIMNSAFKSGKNISQAIEIVKTELPSPIKEEFMIVSKDLNYGLDLVSVFNRFSNRVKVEEAKYITSSLALLNKTGGNIVTVFNMIENNFYERLKIKNELNALTSSSKYMYRMLLGLPIVFILVIICLNPTYFSPLITTTLGKFIDAIMLGLYILYIIVIKKVMKVDKV